MHAIALMLACVACTGHGARAQTSDDSSRSIPEAAHAIGDAQTVAEQSQAKGRAGVKVLFHQLKACLLFLLTYNPKAAYHIAGPGSRFLRANPADNRLHQTLRSRQSSVGRCVMEVKLGETDLWKQVLDCRRQLLANFTSTSSPPYSEKRKSVVRFRVSMQREENARLLREAEALESRLRQVKLQAAEAEAERRRIAQLRRLAAAGEANIIRWKQRAGIENRDGWIGALVRVGEVILAGQYRASRVFVAELNRQDNPWVTLLDNNFAVVRLGTNLTLVEGYITLTEAPRLVPHAMAIYARVSQLERFAPGILTALRQPVSGIDGVIVGEDGRPLSYLDVLEPHLDQILERFDDIEPHLPWVLEHIEVLAPHIGTLLNHFDPLLLYAEDDEANRNLARANKNRAREDSDEASYDYPTKLLDYLPYFAPKLDALAPHLALIQPHVPKLLPVLPIIAPYVERFAPYVSVSANADVLLYYFGWLMKVPILRRILLVPGFPRFAAFMARRLPKWPVRGRTKDAEVSCTWEECDTSYVANAQRYWAESGSTADVTQSVRAALGERRGARELKKWRRNRAKWEEREDQPCTDFL